MEVAMVEPSSQMECPSCNRAFGTKKGISVHHTKKHGEKIYFGKCQYCGGGVKRGDYCSKECRQMDKMKTCERQDCDESHRNIRFCSNTCRNQVFKDDPEWRQAVREGLPEDHCVGQNNPNWRGATQVGFGPQWPTVREKVLERDGRSCVICDDDSWVDVHHVVSREFVFYHPFLSLKDSDIEENLVTLCRSHHRKIETRGNCWDQYPEEVTGLTEVN